MSTVFLGGSFDPVHIGHLHLAEEVMIQLSYDRVVFVPAAEAPHKAPSGASTSAQRLDMLQAAVKDDRRFIVDDCEITRGGLSYTVETVPILQNRYSPEDRLGMIIGDDLIEGFVSWKSHEILAELVDIIIAHRQFAHRVEFAFPHRYVDNLLLPLSSREIRSRVASGKPYRHIVPEPVFRYIERYMLYRQRD